HFEDARRLESTVGDQRHGTDTDCTIPMQTSPKRVIRLPAKLRDYGDDNVPTRKNGATLLHLQPMGDFLNSRWRTWRGIPCLLRLLMTSRRIPTCVDVMK
ncbi:unnamed protein product, partial [Dicrocoelium dendriticum]